MALGTKCLFGDHGKCKKRGYCTCACHGGK